MKMGERKSIPNYVLFSAFLVAVGACREPPWVRINDQCLVRVRFFGLVLLVVTRGKRERFAPSRVVQMQKQTSKIARKREVRNIILVDCHVTYIPGGKFQLLLNLKVL
jgi:hypothetical protein